MKAVIEHHTFKRDGERPEIVAVVDVNPEATVEDELERIFHEWNAGSGAEHPEFLRQRCRSLSSGDVVVVGGTPWLCAFVGWRRMTFDQYARWCSATPGQKRAGATGRDIEDILRGAGV